METSSVGHEGHLGYLYGYKSTINLWGKTPKNPDDHDIKSQILRIVS